MKNNEEHQFRHSSGVTLSNKIIEKNLIFLEPSSTSWDLPVLKLFDLYLSKINARNSASSAVVIYFSDYAKIMGTRMKNISIDHLKSILDRLLQTTIDLSVENTVRKYNLFEYAASDIDKNGRRIISIKCTNTAESLFFNLDKTRYLKYTLQSIVNLRSKNSYHLYLLMKLNLFRSWIRMSIAELKQSMGCTADYYNDFRRFSSKILAPAIAEINTKTDILVTYKAVKQSRIILFIDFDIKSKSSNILEPDSEMVFQSASDLTGECEYELSDDNEENDFENTNLISGQDQDILILIKDLLPNCSEEQIKEIISLSRPHITEKRIENTLCKDIDLAIYDYLDEKVKEMQTRKESIQYPYQYLKKMIKNDE